MEEVLYGGDQNKDMDLTGQVILKSHFGFLSIEVA